MGNKISIMPCGMVEDIHPDTNFKPDLFIATYSLSESSKKAQDLVVGRDWFSAPHLILAYQTGDKRFPTAPWLGEQLLATRENVYLYSDATYAHNCYV